jgi:acylphosphatase
MTSVDVIVSGKVQGVGFRWSTRLHAERLGVTGWVRNLPDRSVQAHLEGPDDGVAALLGWLRTGPIGATVDAVEVSEAPATGVAGFEIRG